MAEGTMLSPFVKTIEFSVLTNQNKEISQNRCGKLVKTGLTTLDIAEVRSCNCTGTPSSQRDLYKYYLVREFNGEKS